MAYGSPRPSIKWIRGNGMPQSYFNLKAKESLIGEHVIKSILEIETSRTIPYERTYVCEAMNGEGFDSRKFAVENRK